MIKEINVANIQSYVGKDILVQPSAFYKDAVPSLTQSMIPLNRFNKPVRLISVLNNVSGLPVEIRIKCDDGELPFRINSFSKYMIDE